MLTHNDRLREQRGIPFVPDAVIHHAGTARLIPSRLHSSQSGCAARCCARDLRHAAGVPAVAPRPQAAARVDASPAGAQDTDHSSHDCCSGVPDNGVGEASATRPGRRRRALAAALENRWLVGTQRGHPAPAGHRSTRRRDGRIRPARHRSRQVQRSRSPDPTTIGRPCPSLSSLRNPPTVKRSELEPG